MESLPELVIVTGAAGGIGRAISETLEQAGLAVIGTDVPGAQKPYDTSYWIDFDLGNLRTSRGLREFERLLTDVIGERQVYALINNAALQLLGAVEELPPESVAQSLDINCLAPFSLTKMMLARLDGNKELKPWIINIASIHSRLTKPEFCAYATSKAALEGLTRAMAVELGARVRVGCIAPAAIETEMLKAGFEGNHELFNSLADLHPSKTIGKPDEIAKLVEFILCGDLPFANGFMWNFDGGISSRLYDPA